MTQLSDNTVSSVALDNQSQAFTNATMIKRVDGQSSLTSLATRQHSLANDMLMTILDCNRQLDWSQLTDSDRDELLALREYAQAVLATEMTGNGYVDFAERGQIKTEPLALATALTQGYAKRVYNFVALKSFPITW